MIAKAEIVVERQYSRFVERILDKILNGRGPKFPFVLLDSNFTIRYASPKVRSVTGYEPKDLIGKSHSEFISSDLYERTLQGLAYRISQTIEKKHTPEEQARKFRIFSDDYAHLTGSLSHIAKIKQFLSIARRFEQRESANDTKYFPLIVRIVGGDGSPRNIEEHITFHKQEGLFSGAIATMCAPRTQESVLKRFIPWYRSSKALMPYQISDEYVLDIESLNDKESIKAYINELISDEIDGLNAVIDSKAERKTVVLDFRDASRIEDSHFDMLFVLVKELAQAGRVIFGNTSEYIRTRAEEKMNENYGKSHTPLRFHQLVYPAVKRDQGGIETVRNHSSLEHYIDCALKVLNPYDDEIPEDSIHRVQQGAKR